MFPVDDVLSLLLLAEVKAMRATDATAWTFVQPVVGSFGSIAVGIILVASCPGGMASNMISYLAKANVALSVVLTLASTMLAFFFTPMWTSQLAGKYVPVDAWGLCVSAFQLTIAPVV